MLPFIHGFCTQMLGNVLAFQSRSEVIFGSHSSFRTASAVARVLQKAEKPVLRHGRNDTATVVVDDVAIAEAGAGVGGAVRGARAVRGGYCAR
jgi:hypothetical protein